MGTMWEGQRNSWHRSGGIQQRDGALEAATLEPGVWRANGLTLFSHTCLAFRCIHLPHPAHILESLFKGSEPFPLEVSDDSCLGDHKIVLPTYERRYRYI